MPVMDPLPEFLHSSLFHEADWNWVGSLSSCPGSCIRGCTAALQGEQCGGGDQWSMGEILVNAVFSLAGSVHGTIA